MRQLDRDTAEAAELDVRVREDPLSTWVTPVGELDLAASERFDRCLRDAQTASRRIVLDLRALEFVDSAGLHAIVAAGLRANQVGLPPRGRLRARAGATDAVALGP